MAETQLDREAKLREVIKRVSFKTGDPNHPVVVAARQRLAVIQHGKEKDLENESYYDPVLEELAQQER